jgi:hypothetical protein
VQRGQHAVGVGRRAGADDGDDRAVRGHLDVHAVLVKEELARLVPADAAAARVHHDAQRVDRHHVRGGEQAAGQLLEAAGGAQARAQPLRRRERAADPLAPVHGEPTAGEVERHHQQRARARGLHRAEGPR